MSESADKPSQMDERESKLYDILDEYARDGDMPISAAANQILALYRPAPDPAVVERLERVRAHQNERSGLAPFLPEDADWLLSTLESLLGIKDSK